MKKPRDEKPLTIKQEKFVHFLFQGFNQRESYVKAGYAINASLESLDQCASRLSSSAKVEARLAYLRKKAEDASVMSVIERKQRLSEIGRAALVDFVDASGEAQLSRDVPNHRAATEFTTTTRYDNEGNPTTTRKIALHSPVQAIQELNKMDGIYDAKEASGNVYNYNIILESEGGAKLLQRVMSGERTRKELPAGDCEDGKK